MGRTCSRRDFQTTGAILFTVISLPCLLVLSYLPYKWAKRHWAADGCLTVCKRTRQRKASREAGGGGVRVGGGGGGGTRTGIPTVTAQIGQTEPPFPVSAGMEDYFNMNVLYPKVLAGYEERNVDERVQSKRPTSQQYNMPTNYELQNMRVKKQKNKGKRML